MRPAFLVVGLIVCAQWVCTTGSVLAEEKDRGSFSIRVTEYMLKSPAGGRKSNAKILKLLTSPENSKNVKQIQTLRLNAIHGQKAKVIFARRATVTTGLVRSAQGQAASRQTQSVELGTELAVTGLLGENTCSLSVSYETSRFEGEGTEDSPPDLVSSILSGTFVAEFGKPLLLGGTNKGDTAFLVLTAER